MVPLNLQPLPNYLDHYRREEEAFVRLLIKSLPAFIEVRQNYRSV
jgi:hypothetical protein